MLRLSHLRKLIAILVLGSAAYACNADETGQETLVISDPWTRPTPGPVRNAAAYFAITNRSDERIRIVGARSQIAPRAELHSHLRDGDIMRMRPLAGVDIPSQGTVRFEPGGYHVMLFGLAEPLRVGDQFAVDLLFADREPVSITVLVGGGPPLDR